MFFPTVSSSKKYQVKKLASSSFGQPTSSFIDFPANLICLSVSQALIVISPSLSGKLCNKFSFAIDSSRRPPQSSRPNNSSSSRPFFMKEVIKTQNSTFVDKSHLAIESNKRKQNVIFFFPFLIFRDSFFRWTQKSEWKNCEIQAHFLIESFRTIKLFFWSKQMRRKIFSTHHKLNDFPFFTAFCRRSSRWSSVFGDLRQSKVRKNCLGVWFCNIWKQTKRDTHPPPSISVAS